MPRAAIRISSLERDVWTTLRACIRQRGAAAVLGPRPRRRNRQVEIRSDWPDPDRDRDADLRCGAGAVSCGGEWVLTCHGGAAPDAAFAADFRRDHPECPHPVLEWRYVDGWNRIDDGAAVHAVRIYFGSCGAWVGREYAWFGAAEAGAAFRVVMDWIRDGIKPTGLQSPRPPPPQPPPPSSPPPPP